MINAAKISCSLLTGVNEYIHKWDSMVKCYKKSNITIANYLLQCVCGDGKTAGSRSCIEGSSSCAV